MAACGFGCVVGRIQPAAFRSKGDGPAASQGSGQCAAPVAVQAVLKAFSGRFGDNQGFDSRNIVRSSQPIEIVTLAAY